MKSVGIRDLRNHGAEVISRVLRGERLVVTRDGAAVAELAPLPKPSRPTDELIARRRNLPDVDPAALRRDLDELIDQAL